MSIKATVIVFWENNNTVYEKTIVEGPFVRFPGSTFIKLPGSIAFQTTYNIVLKTIFRFIIDTT